MSDGSTSNDRAVCLLQAALDDCVAAGAPGALLAVDAPKRNLCFRGASGKFAKGAPQPLRADDPFRAASVTKAVTAASAVCLAARGDWNLDDPIALYLPADVVQSLHRFQGLHDVSAVTIRRLLNHTSGLPDYFFDQGFQARVQAQPERIWRPCELISAAAEVGRIEFAPGTDFSYGDTGYVLVGIAIEQRSGRRLADLYRSLIFAPLGMHATYLEWHEPPRGRELSHHYDGDRDLRPMNTSYDWAGGGLVTTAGDLVRFLRGVFEGGLFDGRWSKQLLGWREDLRWRAGASAHYLRYGLGMGANLAGGEEIIGATGVWGAFAYYWPAAGAAIAGTVNLRGFDRSPLLDAAVCALRPRGSVFRAG